MSRDDNAISQAERIHRNLTTSSRSIQRAYTQAEEDAAAIGYRERHGRYTTRGTAGQSPTETAAEQLIRNGDTAAQWLNEVARIVRDLTHIASQADHHWPPRLHPGATHDGTRVGTTTTDELCAHCGEPVTPGRLPSGHTTIIRVNNQPYHRNTCYTKLWREQQRITESA